MRTKIISELYLSLRRRPSETVLFTAPGNLREIISQAYYSS